MNIREGIFNFLRLFYFIKECLACVCMCTKCGPGTEAREGIGYSGNGVWVFVIHHRGAGNPTQVLCKGKKCS